MQELITIGNSLLLRANFTVFSHLKFKNLLFTAQKLIIGGCPPLHGSSSVHKFIGKEEGRAQQPFFLLLSSNIFEIDFKGNKVFKTTCPWYGRSI